MSARSALSVDAAKVPKRNISTRGGMFSANYSVAGTSAGKMRWRPRRQADGFATNVRHWRRLATTIVCRGCEMVIRSIGFRKGSQEGCGDTSTCTVSADAPNLELQTGLRSTVQSAELDGNACFHGLLRIRPEHVVGTQVELTVPASVACG